LSFSAFRTGRTSISTFCFFGEVLRADVGFIPELLLLDFLVFAMELCFFLRGMGETILSHENFLLTEMFLL